ncbi:MAG: DUF3784 domain-containing protein [Candidatus Methanomethylophilaceae archaeon]|nr:DUF3784 domain-containing protein [Candidatus Methanomethylophilaceae archaeon]
MDGDLKLGILLILMPVSVMVLILCIILSDTGSGTDLVLYIMAIGAAAVSVVMLSGSGGWAVAGYNTMTEEEKSAYDERKVAHGGGIIMLGASVFLALIPHYIVLAFAVLAVSILAGSLYMNKRAKKRCGCPDDPEYPGDMVGGNRGGAP